MLNSHFSNHCPPCFCVFKDKCISIMKTWPEKCPLVYSFHCLPHTNIFLYCQMNFFPLLLKLLWLWKQNQKLPEPSKSIKIYCFINLNMSLNYLSRDMGYKIAMLPGVYFFLHDARAQRGQQGSRLPSHDSLSNISNCVLILQMPPSSDSSSQPWASQGSLQTVFYWLWLLP